MSEKPKRRRLPRAPKDLDDLLKWASWATRAVAEEKIDSQVAHKIALLLGEMRRLIEKKDLSVRIRALQDELHRLRKEKRP